MQRSMLERLEPVKLKEALAMANIIAGETDIALSRQDGQGKP